jgi:hypothetical protein
LLPHPLRIAFGRRLCGPRRLVHLYGAINLLFERLKIVSRNLIRYVWHSLQRHDCTSFLEIVVLERSIPQKSVETAAIAMPKTGK